MGNTKSAFVQQYRRDDIASARELASELDPLFERRTSVETCCDNFLWMSPFSTRTPYYITYNERRTLDLTLSDKERFENLYIYQINYEIADEAVGRYMYEIKVHSPGVKMLVRIRTNENGPCEENYAKPADLMVEGIYSAGRRKYVGLRFAPTYLGLRFVFISDRPLSEVDVSYDSDIDIRGCGRGTTKGLPFILNYPPPCSGSPKNVYFPCEMHQYYEECRRAFFADERDVAKFGRRHKGEKNIEGYVY